MANEKLKKVPAAGGPTVLVADAAGRFDGTWGADDVILLDGSTGDSLMAVPASGGTAKPASSFDPAVQENQHAWPFFLPDGKHFLFVASRNDPTDRRDHIKLGRLGSMESWDLGPTDSRVEFMPPNRVVYVSDGTLVAQPLDLGKHALVGDPVPLTDQVVMASSGLFSVSPGGVLAIGAGAQGGSSELMWTDRAGRSIGRLGSPNAYREVNLSRDGKRLAVAIADPRANSEDIWVIDVERDVPSRLTFDPGNDIWPILSPDGRRVVYASDRGGAFRLYSKAASGVGQEDSLATVEGNEGPTDWSPGGWIASTSLTARTRWDLIVRRADGDTKPEVFLASPAVERDGAFSDDGHWLAYSSDETGRRELYVRSFPGGESKWQVSNGGGVDPTWTRDGREIVYQDGNGTMYAVPVTTGAEFRSGTPVRLFNANLAGGGFGDRRWQVTRDGERFLINTPVGAQGEFMFSVTTNWMETLRQK